MTRGPPWIFLDDAATAVALPLPPERSEKRGLTVCAVAGEPASRFCFGEAVAYAAAWGEPTEPATMAASAPPEPEARRRSATPSERGRERSAETPLAEPCEGGRVSSDGPDCAGVLQHLPVLELLQPQKQPLDRALLVGD